MSVQPLAQLDLGTWTPSALLPVRCGDRIDGVEVVAFAFRGDPNDPVADGDVVLLAGDEDLEEPPARHMQTVAREPGRWEQGDEAWVEPSRTRVVTAASIANDLSERFDRLLTSDGRAWSRFAAPVVEGVSKNGYRVWIAGGAVRDLLAGGGPDEVRDIDLAGTAPPGTFVAIAHEVLVRLGLGTMRLKISGASLVCWLRPPRMQDRALEYKPLAKLGFPFPACGSNMADDLATRDLSVNALFFDPLDGTITDPSGNGIDDLLDPIRRLRSPNALPSPIERATVMLRALKFLARWNRDRIAVDVTPLQAWLREVPVTRRDLSTDDLRALAKRYVAYLGDIEPNLLASLAVSLGDPVPEVLDAARSGANL